MKETLISSEFHVKFNVIMTVVWLFLFIPSLIWWKDALVWIVFMSCYANLVGHFSAIMAAMAEKKIEE